jgi:hypothetical protein
MIRYEHSKYLAVHESQLVAVTSIVDKHSLAAISNNRANLHG